MKKIYALLFAASALFAATSCQVEIVDPTLEDASIKGGMTITATVGAETKTVLGDNGVSTFWTDKDVISVFDSDKDGNNRKFSVVTKNVEFPASKATFALDAAEEFVWPQNNQPDPLIVALYPYQEDAYCDFFYYDRNYITGLEIPVKQNAVKNAFDPTATFALATGKYSTKDELQFTNLYSLLRITLKEEGVTAVKVTVEGGNIAGEAKVQLNLAEGPVFAGGTLSATDEGSKSVTLVCEGGFEPNEKYYIAIAPVTYTNIQVEMLKGETWSKVKDTTPSSPKKLVANHIYNISDLDDPKTIADGVYYNDEGIYEISNEAGLFWLADQVNTKGNFFEGEAVKLVTDIDLENKEWTPIGSAVQDHGFMGNFDGNGKTIKNLKIAAIELDSDGYAYAGLFGVTEGVDANNENCIKNLTIENVTISTKGHIAAAAIAYPYYTTIENIKVKGDINIKAGNYTSGILAYTRRCINAKDLTIEGNEGSKIEGDQTIGGVISDIQMNGGLTAVYSNFNASGLTITGNKNVGGISGIISKQTLDGATVNNVTIVCEDARKGIVSGSLGDVSTIKNITVTNVTGADKVVGATYGDGLEVFVKDDTYSPHKVASTAEELKSAVATDGKVVLAADIVMSEILTISKNVILDGNGKKLTSSAGRAINVSGADDVTIKNLTIVASGERAINVIQNTKKVNIENVTATAANYVVNVASSAPGVEAVIINSTLTGLNVVNIGGPGADVQLTNCTLNCNDKNPTPGEAYAALCLNKVAVGSVIEANGCTFNIAEGSDSMKGSIQPADGVITIDGSTDGVKVDVAVIMQGDYWYGLSTLAKAVEFAADGDEIQLIRDVELTEPLVIPADKNIILDLNGKTVSQRKAQSEAYSMIQNRGNLIIKNGTLDYGDVAELTTAVNYVSNTIWNGDNAELTIESDVTVINNSNSAIATYGYPHAVDNYGTLTINGGTFTNNANYSSIRIWCTTDSDTNVTINGGTFNGSIDLHNVSANANKGTLTINGGTFNADTYTKSAVRLLGFGVDVDEIKAYINGGTFNGLIKLNKYASGEFNDQVFYINGGTFSEISALDYTTANADVKVVLSADVVLTNPVNVKGTVLLDLNGKTVSQEKECTASYNMITNNGNLTVTGNGKISFKDLSNGGSSDWGSYTIGNSYGTLMIESGLIEHLGTADGDFDTCIPIQNYAGKVVINGGTFSSPQFRSLRDFTAGGEIVINGGTFNGQVWMQGLGNGSSTLTINGGEFRPTANDGSSVYITNNTNDVVVTVNAGKFNTKIGCADPSKVGVKGKVKGGVFTESAKAYTNAALIAEGYEFVQNADGIYTLTQTK